MTKLRIAIIGTRRMGAKHLNVLRNFYADEVDIAGIVNSSPASSASRAAELKVF